MAMNIGAGSTIDNPLKMLEYLICTSAKDYSLDKRDFMLYGIICGWETVPHDEYPLNEECAKELDKMHEQYEALKKMFDEGAKPVVHGHWTDGRLVYTCSACGIGSVNNYRYCPHCGATMDEKGR